MIRLLLLTGILLLGVLGLICWLVRAVIGRRKAGLKALADRLSLDSISDPNRLVWYRRWFSLQRLQGLYRGHEIIVERTSQRFSGRFKSVEVLRFACPCVGVPAFEIHPVSPLAYRLRRFRSRLVSTGDAPFDGFFALKAESPAFVLELLNAPIRERLLQTFKGQRARGVICFSGGELSYVEASVPWSSSGVDRFESMVQRLYELSLAVKVFTQEG